jgi:secreted PhoX family phosphatase
VPGFGRSNGQPIRAAGRFSHEAVAVDPRTGVVYETEDARTCAFYKYVQPGAGGRGWRRRRGRRELLRDNGDLFALVVKGEPRKDLTGGFAPGTTFDVEWQPVADPEGKLGRAFDSAPDAAVFSRGEGCWEDRGRIYFVSTDGGAAGLGQVWVYNPRAETLRLEYESTDATDVDGPDNIAISPRGGVILCEDGDSDPKRLIGLVGEGHTFAFAENIIDLKDGDIDIIDAVYPGTKANFWDDTIGSFSRREWAGATFFREWLFANVQSPGVTFAITGPWRRGGL